MQSPQQLKGAGARKSVPTQNSPSQKSSRASARRYSVQRKNHHAGVEEVPSELLLTQLLDHARRGAAYQRAAERGIPEPALHAILKCLYRVGVQPDDLMPWLDDWIEVAYGELDTPIPEHEGLLALGNQAKQLFAEGSFEAISSVFWKGIHKFNPGVDCDGKQKEDFISWLEEAVRFDVITLNRDAMLEKLRLIAVLKGISDPDGVARWLSGRARDFFERSVQKGDRIALFAALAIYRDVLKDWSRERNPLQWAATQNNIGATLHALGVRESHAARLREAIATYYLALEEWTRERVPLQWAALQNNLGRALRALSTREGFDAYVGDAVAAFRLALLEQSRERGPQQWAAIQNNLGNALSALAARDESNMLLERAIAAYQEALGEWTRERDPLRWATSTGDQGVVMMRLAERQRDRTMAMQALSYLMASVEMCRQLRHGYTAYLEKQISKAQFLVQSL